MTDRYDVTVTVRCVSCNRLRSIRAGKFEANDMPICAACGSPMVAERATATRLPATKRKGKKR